jgi:hypothetical protein
MTYNTIHYYTYIGSSNHTLHLHRPTANSSCTTNFPWLSHAANWTHTQLNSFDLNCLQIFPESHYIASALTAQKTQLYCWLEPTVQKTSHPVTIVARQLTAAEMCLPLLCVATSEMGQGGVRCGYSVYSWVHYPATSNKHSYFYCWRACFEVSALQQLSHGENTPQYCTQNAVFKCWNRWYTEYTLCFKGRQLYLTGCLLGPLSNFNKD